MVAPYSFVRALQTRGAVAREHGLDENGRLKRLNTMWRYAIHNVPHWRGVAARIGRDGFRSFGEFLERVPVTEKSTVVSEGAAHWCAPLPARVSWSLTGGTTGNPYRFPMTKSDRNNCAKREWLLRSFVGITPLDAQFKVWGHAHLFAGRNAARLAISRRVKDWLLGFTRESAYDLSPERLDMILARIERARPKFVMAYSRVLEVLAGRARETSVALGALGLKGVIASSEMFTSREAEEEVASVFGAPVYMEYGSAETGPLAFRDRSGTYRIVRSDYFLDAEIDAEGRGKLRITSLEQRAFPLIRYEIGDLVEGANDVRNVTEFSRVVGRVNEQIQFADGRRVHSEALTHAVRSVAGVERFQYVVRRDGHVVVNLIGTASVAEATLALSRLKIPQEAVSIVCNEPLRVTPAGKRPIVFREP